VPLSLLSGRLDWGLAGVWTGLTLFIVLRLVAVGLRVRGTAWLGGTVAA
jgi:Na+-driven multidrug efflux pump